MSLLGREQAREIAELFGVEVHTISYHLKEIFASGELTEEATVRRIRRVQREGGREVSREIEFYNLDAIISVGYRVNSAQATQFRIWASLDALLALCLLEPRIFGCNPRHGLSARLQVNPSLVEGEESTHLRSLRSGAARLAPIVSDVTMP